MAPLSSTRKDTFEVQGPIIRPLVSDNDPSRPLVVTNTTVEPNANGTFEFNREEGPGSVHLRHWQTTIGEYIGQRFLRLGNWTQWHALMPDGYVLYSHCKSRAEDPTDLRVDQYLQCGPNATKFRSPNEFMPHYAWLLEYGPERPGYKCRCKYCRPPPALHQGEINAELGLPDPVRGRKSKAPSKRLVVRTKGNGLYTVSAPT